MNYLDIDKALVDLTRAKCAECKARLDAVPKDKPSERKALLIENGMYTLCGNAGLLFNTYGTREGLYTILRYLRDNSFTTLPIEDWTTPLNRARNYN